jgi:hypothetical protein
MIKKLFRIKLEFDVLTEELDPLPIPGGEFAHADNGRYSVEWFEHQRELQARLLEDPGLLKKYVLTRVTELLDADAKDEINKMLDVDPIMDQCEVKEEIIERAHPETATWFRTSNGKGVRTDNMELVTLSFALQPTAVDMVES